MNPNNPEFLELLKALGMPEDCRKFSLIAEVGKDVVVDTVTLAKPNLKTALLHAWPEKRRRYRLVEIEDGVNIEVDPSDRRRTIFLPDWVPIGTKITVCASNGSGYWCERREDGWHGPLPLPKESL